MLIEQVAYANRWRGLAPEAKGLFACFGLVSALLAHRPIAALGVAGVMIGVTLVGARVPVRSFFRVTAPPLLFLLVGGLSVLFSWVQDAATGHFYFISLPENKAVFLRLFARSFGALSALLFLVLTTPFNDLIALLRRLKVPGVLLELMVLCYRMLFVFSEALHDGLIAQSSRLGYLSPRLALRSLGQVVAALTLQIWLRSHDLFLAAQARNDTGQLRFLPHTFARTRRDSFVATIGGLLLLLMAIKW